MQILISFQSKIPIYEQIVMQIKQQVLEGKLAPGTGIPAMRTLAKNLNVSVITVQKAYEILQGEGFINSMVGRGTFVTLPEIGNLKNRKEEELKREIQRLFNTAYANGYQREEVLELFRTEWENFFR